MVSCRCVHRVRSQLLWNRTKREPTTKTGHSKTETRIYGEKWVIYQWPSFFSLTSFSFTFGRLSDYLWQAENYARHKNGSAKAIGLALIYCRPSSIYRICPWQKVRLCVYKCLFQSLQFVGNLNEKKIAWNCGQYAIGVAAPSNARKKPALAGHVISANGTSTPQLF